MKKKKKKKCFAILKKRIFFTSYWAALLALYFKDDLVSLRRFSYNIINDSKWRRIKKDLPKCLMIDVSTTLEP
jgi:hypothetical protein